jgi:hypothetical protein
VGEASRHLGVQQIHTHGAAVSVFGAGFPVAPDEPVEFAEEVGVIVGAAGQGPIFGHRRPS